MPFPWLTCANVRFCHLKKAAFSRLSTHLRRRNAPGSLTSSHSIPPSTKQSLVALATDALWSNPAHDWSSPESLSSLTEERCRIPTLPFPGKRKERREHRHLSQLTPPCHFLTTPPRPGGVLVSHRGCRSHPCTPDWCGLYPGTSWRTWTCRPASPPPTTLPSGSVHQVSSPLLKMSETFIFFI